MTGAAGDHSLHCAHAASPWYVQRVSPWQIQAGRPAEQRGSPSHSKNCIWCITVAAWEHTCTLHTGRSTWQSLAGLTPGAHHHPSQGACRGNTTAKATSTLHCTRTVGPLSMQVFHEGCFQRRPGMLASTALTNQSSQLEVPEAPGAALQPLRTQSICIRWCQHKHTQSGRPHLAAVV